MGSLGSERGRNGVNTFSLHLELDTCEREVLLPFHSSVKQVGLVRSKGAWCHTSSSVLILQSSKVEAFRIHIWALMNIYYSYTKTFPL